MLLVKTCVKPSPIHGLGCFAVEPIIKGTTMWRLDATFDRVWNYKDYQRLPLIAHNEIKHFVYHCKHLDLYVLCADNARYYNHSRFANSRSISATEDIALFDIAEGEEITINYFEFDADALVKLQA